MSDVRGQFLKSISSYVDLELLHKFMDQFGYIDDDHCFFSNILDAVLIENDSILKSKFISNFYIGFCHCIIKNLLDSYDLVLDEDYFLEETICDILIELMDKDIVIDAFFHHPNMIVSLLESIKYHNQSLLEFMNCKLGELSKCRIGDRYSLVHNSLSMDLVEALSDCSAELNFSHKKLMR